MGARSSLALMLLFAVPWLAPGALADLQIDSGFDSGSIGPYSIDDLNDQIDLALLTDPLGYTYWAHFTVSGVSGRSITFSITNADDVPFLSDPTHEAQMVYSYDRDTWYRLTNHGYADGVYSFTQTFTADEVQIATFFPFRVDQMSEVVDTASLNPWATTTVLGTSHDGRDIDLLTITNALIPTDQKKVIYIVGRQHAAESSSSHMLEGLIDFLLSDDAYAMGLRDNFVWHIVPMLNPDGVFGGHSRANAEGNDPNRDWHPSNHDSVEIDIARGHLDAVDDSDGVDMFIDWHSQMNDLSWHNFVYSPPGNTFFEILSDWSDFDTEKAVGTSCSSSSCSARGYATIHRDLYVFVMEPTPHLVTWTEQTLRNEGVNVAFAVNEYFRMFEGPLLVDSDFEASGDSADLRADGGGPGWLESRQDDPALLTLNKSDVAGNETKKARLSASTVSNAYLTQRFGWPQSGTFVVQWEIYIEEILDLPGSNTDRTGWMLIGDDSDPSHPGPNSDNSERFVYLAFSRDGGGTAGQSMALVARDRDDSWSAFTTLATDLSIGQWYEIKVICDLATDTYEVYLDDSSLGRVTSRRAKSRVTHISFAQWSDGAGTFLVDGEWEPATPAGAVPNGGQLPGVPLMVSKTGGTDITLTWAPSCLMTDTDYALYEGVIGNFASHVPTTSPSCTTQGATTTTFEPRPGARYYLVVPQGPAREGSYGTDSNSIPRPPSISACRPQFVGGCP